MSDARRLDRRSLFDIFRRASKSAPRTPNDAGFSLASFYDGRAEGATPPFARFALREGLAPVATTSVGAGPPLDAKNPHE